MHAGPAVILFYKKHRFKSLQYRSLGVKYVSNISWLTKQHAAVVQHVAKMLKHGTLVLATGATEVAQESTAHHHHLCRSVLNKQHKVNLPTELHSHYTVPFYRPHRYEHPLLHSALFTQFLACGVCVCVCLCVGSEGRGPCFHEAELLSHTLLPSIPKELIS